MADLRKQLRQCLQGRVCLMALGNTDYGDDAFGVRLGESLMRLGWQNVVLAGTMPERLLGRVANDGYDHVVFLDAVEFGGAPGSVVFLSADEMGARFPQVSTHKLSLGLLAKWVEASGKTKAWLLGVQPESLKCASVLTPTMQRTLKALRELLCEMFVPSRRREEADSAKTEPVRLPTSAAASPEAIA
ncbi:MAG: hydrogenase maturation protease [Verrucomicrobiae bacterium]|nr:hydrogenase maturation protease [Verrucomicrobiae bacterium]